MNRVFVVIETNVRNDPEPKVFATRSRAVEYVVERVEEEWGKDWRDNIGLPVSRLREKVRTVLANGETLSNTAYHLFITEAEAARLPNVFWRVRTGRYDNRD